MLPDELDVLLVEDDPPEVELILRALRASALTERVGVARDGEEALDYLLARGAYRQRLGAAPPRLVLLELRLPRLDGIEVVRALRASPRTATIPIVGLSSSVEPREVSQCYQAGANSCVEKPVEFGQLCEALDAVGRYWLRLNRSPAGGPAGH